MAKKNWTYAFQLVAFIRVGWFFFRVPKGALADLPPLFFSITIACFRL